MALSEEIVRAGCGEGPGRASLQDARSVAVANAPPRTGVLSTSAPGSKSSVENRQIGHKPWWAEKTCSLAGRTATFRGTDVFLQGGTAERGRPREAPAGEGKGAAPWERDGQGKKRTEKSGESVESLPSEMRRTGNARSPAGAPARERLPGRSFILPYGTSCSSWRAHGSSGDWPL